MLKKIFFLLVSFLLILGSFLPHDKGMAAPSGLIKITADTVNVREGPSLSYPLVKKVTKGEKYKILTEKGDWTKIELSFEKTGWVANWLITKEKEKSGLDTAEGKNQTAQANADQLRVRSGPGTSFRIVGLLNKGQSVTVLDKNVNWIKVSSPFGEGWVANDYVNLSSKTEANSEDNTTTSNKTSTGIITADLLNVRKQPSTTSTVLGKLSKGDSVTVYSQKSNWVEIKFSNQKAWVNSEFVNLQSRNAKSSSENKGNAIGTVTASSLSVRKDSSLNSPIVGTVKKGQSFTILDESNNWGKIEYSPGKYGWAASWYLEKNTSSSSPAQAIKVSTITILQDGSNIRSEPNVQSDVVDRANEGDTFKVSKVQNDWYEIELKNGTKGYVAGWIVSINGNAPGVEKQGVQNYLKNKTIVLDPGHGGVDNGTTGAGGTLEKDLTLRTARLLYDKLKAAGANVYLTRANDTYISLPSRVSFAQSNQADAFISLHYDSNIDRSVRGMTGYYYHYYQKSLAGALYSSIVNETRMKSRGVRFGDFHVIRENSQKATLIELGYLSNPSEEITLNSGQFQENAATGIYNGLARFFKD